MIKITVSIDLIEKLLLTTGSVGSFKIIEGLPDGCKLVDAQFDRRKGLLELFYHHPDSPFGKIEQRLIKADKL